MLNYIVCAVVSSVYVLGWIATYRTTIKIIARYKGSYPNTALPIYCAIMWPLYGLFAGWWVIITGDVGIYDSTARSKSEQNLSDVDKNSSGLCPCGCGSSIYPDPTFRRQRYT